MRRFFFHILIFIVIIVFFFGLIPGKTSVRAEVGSAYDLIDAMNSLRTSYGYPALTINSTLMSTAQGTAEIMANSGSCSHIGNVSGRVAAAGYGGGATVWATENIACGYDLSVETTVYTYWSDSAHMLPVTNPNYVDVGAGVTVVDGKVYYVLHAAYTSGSSSVSNTPVSGEQATNAAAYRTSQVIQAVITSTPNPDGSVIHEVKAGQSLWSIAIAYGVKIAELIKTNNLPEKPILYIGQKILVFPSSTPTLSPTVTNTSKPVTRTPTRTVVPKTPTPSPTPTSTPTPTKRPLINVKAPDWFNNHALGIGLVAISAIGLVAMVVFGVRKK
jgi:LysM repeat protein